MTIIIPSVRETIETRTPGIVQPGQVTAPAAQAGQQEPGEQIGRGIQDIGRRLGQVFIQMQQRQDAAEVSRLDTQFRLDMQNLLFDEERDQEGKVKGILNRRLAASEGSTQELDRKFQESRRAFIGEAKNPAQQAALASRMDTHFLTRRNSVIRHEATQGREDLKVSTEANLKQRVLDAQEIDSPRALRTQIDETIAIQDQTMAQLDRPMDEIELARTTISTRMANASVLQTLETNPVRAQALLNGVKSDLPPGAVTALQDSIDKKVFSERRNSVAESMVTTSGIIPLTLKEMRRQVFSNKQTKGMSLEEKEKVWDYTKKLLNEENVQKRKEEQAQKEKDADLRRVIYIKAINKSITVEEIDTMFANDQISESFRDKAINVINRKHNDPKISVADKSKKYMDLFDDWLKLNGTEAEEGRITENASDNTFEEMEAFQNKLIAAIPFLTEKQHRDLQDSITRNLSQPVQAKMGIIESMTLGLKTVGLTSPAMAGIVSKVAFDILQPNVDNAQASEMSRKVVDDAKITVNPQFAAIKAQFDAGKTVILTSPSGKKGKVIGIDDRGFPELEWIR